MTGRKGRVLRLHDRLHKPPADPKPGGVRLRGNELCRLLSILNKVKWGRELTPEDENDLDEIEAIEQGRRTMLQPDDRFFPPAFTRHDPQGVLCWFQNVSHGPLRELTPEEYTFWKRVGPAGFHGYLRLDGTIQAYLLSGCEDSSIPWTYPDRKSDT